MAVPSKGKRKIFTDDLQERIRSEVLIAFSLRIENREVVASCGFGSFIMFSFVCIPCLRQLSYMLKEILKKT